MPKIVSYLRLLFLSAPLFLSACMSDHTVPVIDLPNVPPVTANPANSKTVIRLLPLQGDFSHQGQIVQAGFDAAQKAANNQLVNAKTLDTRNYGTANMAYQAAQSEQPVLIVGPLTKPAVNELSLQPSLPLPTLALNSSEPVTVMPLNLFEFSLSPQADAEKVGPRIMQKNIQKVIVIAPFGEWGQGISQSFSKTWSDYKGQIADNYAYNSTDNFSAQMQTLAQKHLGNASDTAIFLVCSAKNAPIVVPAIKAAFPGMSIYSLPMIFDATNPSEWPSLEGLNFQLSPWQMNDQNPARLAFQAGNPGVSAEDLNLYGFGMDVYSLAQYYVQNGGFDGVAVQGNSGYLTIDTNGIIQRQLSWVTISNGKPIAASS